ncbi:MAG TPA: hypothetical protein VLJ86_06625 [Ramlibacter sp.]|nr:hypothetical protein [Ramlibacter sp.]
MALLRECLRSVRDLRGENGPPPLLKTTSASDFDAHEQPRHMADGERNDVFGRAATDFLQRNVPAARARRRLN